MGARIEYQGADPIARECSEAERKGFEKALDQAGAWHKRMEALATEVLQPADRVLVVDMTNGYGVLGTRNHQVLQRLDAQRLRFGILIETGCGDVASLQRIGTQRATIARKLGIRPEKVDVYNPWQQSTVPSLNGHHALIVFSGSPAYLLNGSEQDRQMTARARRVLDAVLQNGTPFIGICYGMQLTCAAMGAQVFQVGGNDATYCLSGPQAMEPTPFGQQHPLHHSSRRPIAIAYHRQAVRVTPATDPRLRVLSTYPGTDTVTMATVRGNHGIQGLVTQLHTEVGIPAIHAGAVANGVDVNDTDRLLPHIDAVSRMSERFFTQALEMVRSHRVRK